MKLRLDICRFDPMSDNVPRFQRFVANTEGNQTILDALLLAWQQDPSLAFRRSCRSAICGSCAIRINGHPALACQTLVSNAVKNGDPVKLEPLPYFLQLKDLVVDIEPLFESLKAVVPWLILRGDYDGRMDAESVRELENPATCILCGICQADLDESSEVSPVAVVKGARFAMDTRDSLGMHRMKLLQVPRDILRLFIRQLPKNCPKGIEISEQILRSESL